MLTYKQQISEWQRLKNGEFCSRNIVQYYVGNNNMTLSNINCGDVQGLYWQKISYPTQ